MERINTRKLQNDIKTLKNALTSETKVFLIHCIEQFCPQLSLTVVCVILKFRTIPFEFTILKQYEIIDGDTYTLMTIAVLNTIKKKIIIITLFYYKRHDDYICVTDKMYSTYKMSSALDF